MAEGVDCIYISSFVVELCSFGWVGLGLEWSDFWAEPDGLAVSAAKPLPAKNRFIYFHVSHV